MDNQLKELLKHMELEYGCNAQTLKIFCSGFACQIPISFYRNVPWVILCKNCSGHTDGLKNMAQECSFVGPLSKLFKDLYLVELWLLRHHKGRQIPKL